MIYWFSGNGNSRHVALELASRLHESARPITDGAEVSMAGGRLGLVCPVYAWGIPQPVLDFVAGLPEKPAEEVNGGDRTVWAVLTFGDDTGMAAEQLIKAFGKRGLEVSSVHGVRMPNTYVILRGFDVDSPEVAREKILASRERIDEIARSVAGGEKTVDVVRGSFPRLRSALWPMKGIWACKPRKWHHTQECTGCGICSQVCPMGNIEMKGDAGFPGPSWGMNCCSCLACYHHCPEHAAAYGHETRGKGQYYFKPIKDRMAWDWK